MPNERVKQPEAAQLPIEAAAEAAVPVPEAAPARRPWGFDGLWGQVCPWLLLLLLLLRAQTARDAAWRCAALSKVYHCGFWAR